MDAGLPFVPSMAPILKGLGDMVEAGVAVAEATPALVMVSVAKNASATVVPTIEVVSGAVVAGGTMQEQAEEILDGEPEHCETSAGRPVVWVCTAVVYFAQNEDAEANWPASWR